MESPPFPRNVARDPMSVSLLGASAVVARADGDADAVEEFWPPPLRQHRPATMIGPSATRADVTQERSAMSESQVETVPELPLEPEAAPADPVPQHIGRYRIERLLG